MPVRGLPFYRQHCMGVPMMQLHVCVCAIGSWSAAVPAAGCASCIWWGCQPFSAQRQLVKSGLISAGFGC